MSKLNGPLTKWRVTYGTDSGVTCVVTLYAVDANMAINGAMLYLNQSPHNTWHVLNCYQLPMYN